MIAAAVTTTAPTAPARLGQAMAAADALRYLEALTDWRDRRKAELDQLDQAALAASDTCRHSPTTCSSRWRCGRRPPTGSTCSW